jgi:hypothetical protein
MRVGTAGLALTSFFFMNATAFASSADKSEGSSKTYRLPNYGMAGCGPGTLVLSPRNKSAENQLSIASSNDTSVFSPAPSYLAATEGLALNNIFVSLGLGLLSSTVVGYYGGSAQGLTIATGTSNCTDYPLNAGALLKEQQTYVAVNFENLSKEAAQGRGEHLRAFSEIVGCRSSAEYEQFAKLVRESHREIFSDSEPENVLSRWKSRAGVSCLPN